MVRRVHSSHNIRKCKPLNRREYARHFKSKGMTERGSHSLLGGQASRPAPSFCGMASVFGRFKPRAHAEELVTKR